MGNESRWVLLKGFEYSNERLTDLLFKPSSCHQLLAEEGEKFPIFWGISHWIYTRGDFIKPLFTLTGFHFGSLPKVQA